MDRVVIDLTKDDDERVIIDLTGDDNLILAADVEAGPEWINTVTDKEAFKLLWQAYNSDPQATCFIAPTKYGLGLFAKKEFRKDELIGTYWGPDISDAVGDALPDEYDRLMDSPRAGYVIGGNWMQADRFNFCSFINDPGYRGSKEVGWDLPEASANCRAWVDGEQVVFRTRSRVRKGAELLFFYGSNYWKGKEAMYYPEQRFHPTLRGRRPRSAQISRE